MSIYATALWLIGRDGELARIASGALTHQFLISDTSREPSLLEAMTVVDDFDLSPPDAANAVLKIIAVVNDWQSHFRSVGVTEADITEIAAMIDAPDLLAQRQSFSAEAYAQSSKPRRKRSPGAKVFR